MKEIKGKYGTAKIFTDLVDEKSIEQVRTLMNQDFVEGCNVRMMPDIHAGAGCTIGTTMQIKDKVCPNLVGVDIGCGMYVSQIENRSGEELDLERLDRIIRDYIPSGFNIRDKEHPYNRNLRLDELRCRDFIDIQRARLSLGTLGGGNHFIEIDKDDEGNLYLVVHSGSRHLGLEVAKFYQKLAEKSIKGTREGEYINKRNEVIEKWKAAGKYSEINSELEKLKSSFALPPKELSYLMESQMEDYIHDMDIIQEYAKWNRLAIADDIRHYMDLVDIDEFHTIHNYIDPHTMILRKGSVRADKDERLLIPINMRDGSLICVGKGNPDWNYSAPHGAGRLMSRSEAKKKVDISEFEDSMVGIYSTSVGVETLDESPMAYKPMESIVENIGDTVDILKVIKPIYNFKAGEV